MQVFRSILLAASCSVLAAPAFSDAQFGAYLAARQASLETDFVTLSKEAERALIARPENVQLLESLISARLSTGETTGLRPFVDRLIAQNPQSQIAAMADVVLLGQEEAYGDILSALEDGRSLSPVLDVFVKAWAIYGTGGAEAAAAIFDELRQEQSGFDTIATFNLGLVYALDGQYEQALSVLDENADVGSRAYNLARLQLLSQVEGNEAALAFLQSRPGGFSTLEEQALLERLERRRKLAFDVIASPKEGLAEVFFTVTAALDGSVTDELSLLYMRLAEALRPQSDEYTLYAAELLERIGRYDLAAQAYEQIEEGALAYPFAALGSAEALRNLDRPEEGLEILKQLTKAYPDLAFAFTSYGDALSRAENYKDAAKAYERAIELSDPDAQSIWPLYYYLAISYEREGQWKKAEPNFRKALELEPDQPNVLNYLGYSFLEMKINLDEAMEMIEKASAARPQSGAITDSLAWGLFRLRRYEEAVAPMERAAELLPTDPIINDHLGDVYWAVGREREALFQWRRALSFDPEDKELERIRLKLEIGLDAVLIQEGEAPTRP